MDYNKRPLVHFTPQRGWNNDPNGLVYINGCYHMFYQYYPDDVVWGPMHWGHAISKDMLHWEELPIAIYPDDLGFIFSGSCVLDVNNISGFGSKENPPLIAMYTSHKEPNHQEQQSIAYSLDYQNFTKYEGNPVIPNEKEKDFRDPKIFYNPVLGNYSMVLATGHCVSFYHSNDLKKWEKTGEFVPGENGYDGICECPDCFPLWTEEGEKWILVISMIVPDEKISEDYYYRMGHVTQYFVGNFDGKTFQDTQKSDKPLLIDYGTDNYAAVTFQNAEDKIILGWKDNWDYANKTPTAAAGYHGSMTMGRKMKLSKVGDEYRLQYEFAGLDWKNEKVLKSGKNKLNTDTFAVEFTGEGMIEICNKAGENIKIIINSEKIIVDRSQSGENEFQECFGKKKFSINEIARMDKAATSCKFVFDKNSLELLADGGLIPVTINVYPEFKYDELEIKGNISGKIIELMA